MLPNRTFAPSCVCSIYCAPANITRSSYFVFVFVILYICQNIPKASYETSGIDVSNQSHHHKCNKGESQADLELSNSSAVLLSDTFIIIDHGARSFGFVTCQSFRQLQSRLSTIISIMKSNNIITFIAIIAIYSCPLFRGLTLIVVSSFDHCTGLDMIYEPV